MTARLFIVIAGTWLIVSAFALPHGHAQALSTGVGGALLIAFSMLSMAYGWARYLAAAAAVALFVATLKLGGAGAATIANNSLMAISSFCAALLTGTPGEVRHEHELYGRV